jgi:hypothetical protein
MGGMTKIGFIMMALLLVALVLSHAASAQMGLKIESFQTQLVSGPDREGYVEFTLTATAYNPSKIGQWFFVSVRALDGDGYPVVIVSLTGRIGGREVGTLTGNGSMPFQAYQSIATWEPF